MGGTPHSALPIEFEHQIRPWFQPFLYYVPIRALTLLGNHNPFTWALAIRLLSALIGWLSVVCLALCVPLWISTSRWQKASVIALSLFWCLPALHARHSSENLSGALFVIGLCGILRLLHSSRRAHSASWIGLGALWGFAFEARYQVGFMVAGGFFWLGWMIFQRDSRSGQARWPQWLLLFSGTLLAVGFGTVLDRLGYGQWTFAPWNYFHFNLIQDYVSSTDVSPWWDYFRRSWTESWPGLGFLTLAGLIIFWVLEPWHFLTWTHAPLFLVHLAIGHKETRFLFPLAHAAPIFLMLLLASPKRNYPWGDAIWRRRPLKILFEGVIAMNLVALITLSIAPAAPAIRFYQAVYDRSITELYYSEGWNPYTILGIPMYFYRSPQLKTLPLEKPLPSTSFWYASPKLALTSEENTGIDAFLNERCELVARSLPDLGEPLRSRLRNWSLFHCRAN